MPAVTDLLRAQGMAIGDVDCLAVGVGPGSFTGIRVAVGTAQGIGLAGRTQLKALDSMALIAMQAGPGLWHLALDARLGEAYRATYHVDDELRVVSAPELVKVGDLDRPTQGALLGDGWALNQLDDAAPLPEGAACEHWTAYADARPVVAPEALLPVYLRDTVNWKKRVDQPSPLRG